MIALTAFVALLAPLAFLIAALVARTDPGLRPARALAAGHAAALAGLGAAALSVLALFVDGASTSPLLGISGIGLSVRLDPVSVTMLALVAFVGAVVLRFSRSYLDGDARQGLFVGRLCLTLAAVMALVIAGNLAHLLVAWIATSLALHKLLLFYAERPRARLAARKKFVSARLGDALLFVAVILLAHTFQTTDIATILTTASTLAAVPASVIVAALLIALAALVKSAQFPTHGWLPEVMETPTPVSALLHAGIINAGGFLVIRFADVMVLVPGSLYLLAIMGGFTALFAGAVMLTQTSIKGSIAWSTVAQMGFMLLQCGLGLFALALLHIVAHSLYKAHAFLSSGSAVETVGEGRALARLAPKPTHLMLCGFLALAVALGLAGVFAVATGGLFGEAVDTSPQALALGAILIMGLTVMIVQAVDASCTAPAALGAVLPRVIAAAGVVTLAYLTLHAGVTALYATSLPLPPPLSPVGITVIVVSVVSFAAVLVLQVIEPARAASPAWRAARVHLANGLYANAVFDRWVGGLEAPDRIAKA